MIVRRGYRKPPTFHQDRLRQAAPGYTFDVMESSIYSVEAANRGLRSLLECVLSGATGLGKRPQDCYAVLISRHGDGAINAAACEEFGIRPIRASGGKPRFPSW